MHFRPPRGYDGDSSCEAVQHSLTQREREIVVCVIVGKWHTAFSIDAHSGTLIGLGVSPDIADALSESRSSTN
jgi:hypothetical protein